MDPNTALANLRDAIGLATALSDGDPVEYTAEQILADMTEAAMALDEWLSKDGFLPDDWQAEEDKPAPPATDEDPHERFQMYTPEGNAAVAGMVQRVLAEARSINASRNFALVKMRGGVREIAKTYPEVRDTAPREVIMDALDEYCDARGWPRLDDGSL